MTGNRLKGVPGGAYGGRKLLTVVAVAAGGLFGWHAVFGANGITAYAQKRGEDRVLQQRIEKLQDENVRLKSHVERLQSDRDTIEVEARQRLHYTRPGEVIYTLPEAR